MPGPAKVLFVCIGNSCRSQIAEALARHTASDVMNASSAGIAPLGVIAEGTREVLEERGVPIDDQCSKALRPEDRQAADLIVNMTGWPGQTLFVGDETKVEDWDVRDPYGGDIEAHRRTCDEIEQRVAGLAKRLRQKQAEAGEA